MPNTPGEHRTQLLAAMAVTVLILCGILLIGKHIWLAVNVSIQPLNVMAVLAPLLLTAGFIERAVEVVISPWRDPEADRLQKQADRSRLHRLPCSLEDEHALHRYRSQTMQYAFAAAMAFGLAAAIAGVRALGAFVVVDPQHVAAFTQNVRPFQQDVFNGMDILLSALLLAGGANGIHSVVSAFTSYFDSVSQMNSQKATQTAMPPTATATTQVTVLAPSPIAADPDVAAAQATVGS